tara:strand:- start:126713 stop:128998 length:2286 start_codon:yes stop_codon:yes gene_type:complete
MKRMLSVVITFMVVTTMNSLYAGIMEIQSAFITSDTTIVVTFTGGMDVNELTVTLDGQNISGLGIDVENSETLIITTNEPMDLTSKTVVTVSGVEVTAKPHWKAIDTYFSYDGELGAIYSKQATEFKLWAPLATEVVLQLFEDGEAKEPSDSVELTKGKKGVWSAKVMGDQWGVFYNYLVTNFGETKEVLDPYAKSMAVTTDDQSTMGKGAVVDPKLIGPDLEYATIKGFDKREDAIIWEIHVRDFTSDPDLETDAQFGTYEAFTEKVDYIKDLGVTHVQLLPVLSYRWGNELDNGVRMDEYKVGTNYNWGYDPHNYFSVEGMYSTDPTDPALRIKELKDLIRSVHEQGMGVTLDVVYNHTASVALFEDIVPGYYHFMDAAGNPKSSYGGGRLGSTHAMTRKLIVDSIVYWTKYFKVDGFRYDLMGDLDGETVQLAYDEAVKLNPKLIKVGEGWRTYAGDDGDNVTPADQDWMGQTEAVASFSDEMRNEIKSGYGSEGEARFITGGARDIQTIYNQVIAKPSNMTEDDPGDVLQYIAAHDNLTLHDVIAYSADLDPATKENEIQKRIRLGNAIILTSQGIAFIHAGQEYGRTKQWLSDEIPESDFTFVEGFEHPYFIENSFNSSDAVNYFDWDKVTDKGVQQQTMEFTKGLIALRKSSDAFRLGTENLIAGNVQKIESEDIADTDLVLAFSTTSTSGETFYVFVNADSKSRKISLPFDLRKGEVLVDGQKAGTTRIRKPEGVKVTKKAVTLDPLTVTVIRK